VVGVIRYYDICLCMFSIHCKCYLRFLTAYCKIHEISGVMLFFFDGELRIEPTYGSTAVSSTSLETSEDDQCWSKHVMCIQK
jgi:hypothetical protein